MERFDRARILRARLRVSSSQICETEEFKSYKLLKSDIQIVNCELVFN